MLLADRCSAEFSSQIKSRGSEYFQDGRVTCRPTRGREVRASVEGSSIDSYEVLLDWSEITDGFLAASCTCPHFSDGNLCKHIWAAILAADEAGTGARIPGPRRVTVLEDEPELLDDEDDGWRFGDDDEDEAWPVSGFPQTGRSSSGLTKRNPFEPRQAPDWRHHLSALASSAPASVGTHDPLPLIDKTREAWYLLNVASSVSLHTLVIELFQRETKLNGEFGKYKSLSISLRDIDQFTHAADREVLGLLLSTHSDVDSEYGPYRNQYSYYGHKVSEIAIAPATYQHVVPRLCATGRLLWALDSLDELDQNEARPIDWDGGPAWRFRLRVGEDQKEQEWVLTGQLTRAGVKDPVSIDKPVLVLSGGLMLWEDRLALVDASDRVPWLDVLRKRTEIRVPFKDCRDFLEHLWRLPSLPETTLPEGLRWQQVHDPPRGRLQLHSSDSHQTQRLYAKVQFQYGDRMVPADQPCAGVIDVDQQRILVRDRRAERQLLLRLGSLGFRPVDGYGWREMDAWLPKRLLADVIGELVDSGWIVEAEGRRIRKPGTFQLSVTSGIDWFDLEGKCDFDGLSAQLPDLLAALRNGEKYIRLDDGSHGLLPQEWLARFVALAGLGDVQEKTVRFRSSQALVLDALLAAQEKVSVDQRFARIRRKLRQFDGIATGSEPRGFHGKLRQYQKEGLGWLNFLRDFSLGGCLADDMGLGKTVQVLGLLQARRRRRKDADGRRAPTLAVVPRSLVFNWIEEAGRFTPRLRVLNYTGPNRSGALAALENYDLVITTYGTLRRDIAKIKDYRFDYAVLDEAQAVKNDRSQNAKACRLINAEHRLALTGTPVENHLGELWSLFEFLNPGMLGSSAAFQAVSKNASAGDENLTLLARALAPFILRRTKEQVLKELPEKTEQTLYCDLEGKQRRQYNDLREYYRVNLSKRIKKTGLAKAKIQVLEALLRLRQVACHPGLLDKDKRDHSSAKLDVLLEQLAEVVDEGHKALVFSQFTSLLAIVRRRLDRDNVVYEYLDGRTRKRGDKVRRFQEDAECPLFLISLRAGGQGLNLTAADYVFILDPWWNPAVEAQAVDRAHRIGQTRRVFAYRIIARDTVEEKILELQKNKRDLADAIISADSSILRELTTEDLHLLLS